MWIAAASGATESGWTPQQLATLGVALGGLALGIFNFFRARSEPGRKRQGEHRKEMRDKLVASRTALRTLEGDLERDQLGSPFLPSPLSDVKAWSEFAYAPAVADERAAGQARLLASKLGLLEAHCFNVFTGIERMQMVRDDPHAYADARSALTEYKRRASEPLELCGKQIDELIKRLDVLDLKG